MLRTYSTRILTSGPFAEKKNLVSISTARVARQDLSFDILNAKKIVEQACVSFGNAYPPKVNFHHPM
jgi:hypothetical protein